MWGCTSCATCHVLVDPAWMSKLPDRDQAELMLLQYAEHYDPERSRLSCQLQLGPELTACRSPSRRKSKPLLMVLLPNSPAAYS
ncbi:MAG: hypothetical protein CM15mP84_05440 [Cellvibrionales bacterium]|nr:MAG: hypothetical protein CM15mP84_05440 [Cellvibrionales bacterium]